MQDLYTHCAHLVLEHIAWSYITRMHKKQLFSISDLSLYKRSQYSDTAALPHTTSACTRASDKKRTSADLLASLPHLLRPQSLMALYWVISRKINHTETWLAFHLIFCFCWVQILINFLANILRKHALQSVMRKQYLRLMWIKHSNPFDFHRNVYLSRLSETETFFIAKA